MRIARPALRYRDDFKRLCQQRIAREHRDAREARERSAWREGFREILRQHRQFAFQEVLVLARPSVVERLLDLSLVVGSLALGLILSGGGDAASRSMLIAGVAIVGAGVVTISFIAFAIRRDNAGAVLLRPLTHLPGGVAIAARVGVMLRDFAQLLGVVRTRHFLVSLGLTVPIWTLEICAMWSVCRSVGAGLTAAGIMLLVGAASLSTILPTAPGYVGSYQFAYVVILRQFGIDATVAIAAATAVQAYLIGSITLVGSAVWALSAVLPARRAAGGTEGVRS